MAKVAILMASDFEDSEFRVPFERLRQAGHGVTIVGSEPGKAVHGKQREEEVLIQLSPDEASPGSFDALVIPGGYAPDKLRTDPRVVGFVRDFVSSGKPVAAVCHGPQLLIEAKVVEGRRVTSWPSVRKDLENAGARWVDEAVVQDGALITSRKPDDLEAFSGALLTSLSQATR